jgi:hypothetical protein
MRRMETVSEPLFHRILPILNILAEKSVHISEISGSSDELTA